MKVVEFDEIKEVNTYATLSYCWADVGEIFKKDESIHIFYENGKIHKNINFKELIQYICKKLNISYLWMDQLCINQNDKEDKRKEIKNMHKIYFNAKYTIVLIPELIDDRPFWKKILDIQDIESKIFIIRNSRWYTRIWTLEETFLSKTLIFIGDDIILLSKLNENYSNKKEYKKIVDLIYSSEDFNDFMNEKITANMIFRRSHYRNTTNKKDFIFGLINLFDVDKDKYINMKNDNIADMLIYFYKDIIIKDSSLLCFGNNGNNNIKICNTISSGEYCLPSWTGQNGIHVLGIVKEIENTHKKWWKDNNLYINSDFVKYRVSKIKNIIKKSGMFINYSIIEKDITDTDFRVINLDNNNKKYICEWYLSLTNDFKYNNDIYILNFGFNQNIPNPKLKKTEDSIITNCLYRKI